MCYRRIGIVPAGYELLAPLPVGKQVERISGILNIETPKPKRCFPVPDHCVGHAVLPRIRALHPTVAYDLEQFRDNYSYVLHHALEHLGQYYELAMPYEGIERDSPRMAEDVAKWWWEREGQSGHRLLVVPLAIVRDYRNAPPVVRSNAIDVGAGPFTAAYTAYYMAVHRPSVKKGSVLNIEAGGDEMRGIDGRWNGWPALALSKDGLEFGFGYPGDSQANKGYVSLVAMPGEVFTL